MKKSFKRSKMSKKSSKKDFRKKAQNVHPKNHSTSPMRGGIRF
jgi:hypothetical protein